jgi:hypothetical protein
MRCDLYGQVSVSDMLFFFEISPTWALLNVYSHLSLSCYLTGQEVLRKGHADLRWTPLWCFSCMFFHFQYFYLFNI